MTEKLNLDRLARKYNLASTASALFNSFESDPDIIDLANSHSFQEIKVEFVNLANNGISKLEDLVLAYAFYMSLLQKDYKDVINFLNNEGNITFELFPLLKKRYLKKQASFSVNSIKIDYNYSSINWPKSNFLVLHGVSKSLTGVIKHKRLNTYPEMGSGTILVNSIPQIFYYAISRTTPSNFIIEDDDAIKLMNLQNVDSKTNLSTQKADIGGEPSLTYSKS